jgi:hypothetical protein
MFVAVAHGDRDEPQSERDAPVREPHRLQVEPDDATSIAVGAVLALELDLERMLVGGRVGLGGRRRKRGRRRERRRAVCVDRSDRPDPDRKRSQHRAHPSL